MTKKCADENFYAAHGLARGIFFDRETFGADKLVMARKGAAWRDILAGAPLPDKARDDIVRIEEGKTDYFPGLSSAENKARLARMSYRDFLRDVVKAGPAAIAVYQARSHGEWGVGADAVSALDVWAFDFPGFRGSSSSPVRRRIWVTRLPVCRWRLLHVSFSRRQRVARATSGPQSHS